MSKGLSQDIELAVSNNIEALEYNSPINAEEPEKLKTAMDAKVTAFKETKSLIHKWMNSPNAPSEAKLHKNIGRLVKAGENSVRRLREALRLKINYNEIEEDKHEKVVKSKGAIYTAIVEIDAGLSELRLQLNSNNYNLGDKEFKIGYPEKFAKGEFYPKSNYHKEWYNEKKDAVKICPFGTEGEVIVLEGLNIQLPKPPPKKDILFSDLPKKEQYWRREDVPKGLTPDNVDAYADFILEQFRLRREGVWFMNHGEPVYLTGRHWFAMVYGKMLDNGKYMDFRYAQRDMFYHAEACIVDPRCIGEIFEKSRRTGFTFEVLYIILEDSTGTKNGRYGFTSKKDDDAEKAWSKFRYAFQNLPFFFKPVLKGAEDSTTRYEFAKPSDRSKEGKKRKDNDVDDYLNSIVDYEATTEGAYDGQAMTIYLGDEASKWPAGKNFQAHWGQISPTFDEGGTVVGKAFIGSTIAAMAKGGSDFKRLAESSAITKRNEVTGRTPSGLYRYMLPAHKNLRQFTDKYGVCWEQKPPKGTLNVDGKPITHGSIEYLENRRSSKKSESQIAYNEELRAFPMNRFDMYRDEMTKSTFNVEKIHEQLFFNEGLVTPMVIRGNFAFSGVKYDSNVEFHPNPNGKFYISWLQDPEYRNKKRKGIRGWEPLNGDIGVGGVDSYDLDETIDSRHSDGALHLYNKWNMVGPSYTFVLEYIERPPYADIFYDDVLMAAIFYGYPLLIENNKFGIFRHFQRVGYGGYAMMRPDHLTPPGQKQSSTPGVPSNSQDVKNDHSTAIERYIHKYVGTWSEKDANEAELNGEPSDRQIGSVGNMYFERTLNDWLGFDINKRTKFDASISSGYALLAAQKPVKQKQETTDLNSKTLFRRYDNSGSKSKIVDQTN